VVLVLAALVFLLVVLPLWNEPDEASCQPPSEAAAAAAAAAVMQVQQAPKEKRQQLRRAERRFRSFPSPRTRRQLRLARADLRRAVKKRDRWNSGATAQLPEGTTTAFKLGHDVNAGPRSIKFTLNRPVPGPRYIQVSVQPFASTTTGAEFARADLTAWARLDPGRRSGMISFCVDPDARQETRAAGEFAGGLLLGSRRVEAFEVPVTFSASYPRQVLVAIVGLGVCIFSSLYVYILRRPQLSKLIVYGRDDFEGGEPTSSDRENASRVLRMRFGFWGGYVRFVSGASGVVTVAAGLLGAVTAFKLQYLSADAWSATAGEWLTFSGAVATAFIAAGTAGRLAQNKYEDPDENPPQANPPDANAPDANANPPQG
jgi:hypothetical protein